MPFTAYQLAQEDPHVIAKEYGCYYSGDVNTIDHGGYFYETHNWDKYGYAEIVEFWVDPDTNETVVDCGTVNKRKEEELTSALRAYDMIVAIGELPREKQIHTEIHALKSHWGYEVSEDFSGRYQKRFKERRSDEFIWQTVIGWIIALKSA